jgi:hypothetical protein
VTMNTLTPVEKFELTADQIKAVDMLASDAKHCGLGGGARSGKTFLIIWAIVTRCLLAPGGRHAILRFRFNALYGAVIEDTFPKVMRLCFPGLYDGKNWTKSPDWFYEFSNGSQIWFGGLDDNERVEKILGREYCSIYFNEGSQIPWNSIILARTRLAQKVTCNPNTQPDGIARELVNKFYYDFNPPSKIHWTYLTFIEHKDPITKQMVLNPERIGFNFINPYGNRANLSSDYIEELEALPPLARDRFLLGKFADNSDGQLFDAQTIEQNRVLATIDNPLPTWLRVVIAVDPSGCSGPENTRSDEIGIIVAALGIDGDGYVLADLSGRYGPADWAKVVGDAYERFGADRVIGESNFGGAMVESTMLAENPLLPVSLVTASRGKVVRAEPISHLYHRARIHHVGHHPEVEDQLCGFTQSGYQGIKSPDRADALVWAITELFPAMVKEIKERNRSQVQPNVIMPKRGASRYSRR